MSVFEPYRESSSVDDRGDQYTNPNMMNTVPLNEHLWSQSVGENATAVAASGVLMTVTEVHFPSRFFQILTYSFIRFSYQD